MSQFDYPRINFLGKCMMDPATANNDWYLPLVFFDPVSVEVFMPPRIYLDDEYLPVGTSLENIKKIIPSSTSLTLDETSFFKGSFYVEITPISDEVIFREWAIVPLGEFDDDREYIPLYEAVYSPGNRGPLIGSIPGYWNYYGSMKFRYDDVKVSSIAIGTANGKEVLLTDILDEGPADVKELLGAKLTMNAALEDDSTNAAVMIDLLPTMAMYSQIFCDRLTLHKSNKIFFSGSPSKASLRLVNAFRVVNENMPFSGSGVFISAIPIGDLDEKEDSAILSLFTRYGDGHRKLKGILIYQAISEVEENRQIDYRRDGRIPNPAFATLSGRICPWYEGEMRSWPISRQLIGDQPYLTNRNMHYDAPVSIMTPALFNFNKVESVLQLDFLNNFPIRHINSGDGPFSPDPRAQNSYEVYPLGDLEVCLERINDQHETTEQVSLGTIRISEDSTSRDQLYKEGGMFILPLGTDIIENNESINNWNLSIFATVSDKRIRIMTESPMVVVSDECGLYSNQGDEPSRGYRSYSGEKQQCIIRIFERGRPVNTPTAISFVEYKISSSGALRTESMFRSEEYIDGDTVTFDTAEPRNAIYLFLPFRTSTLPKHGYPASVIQTGFFVNLRVLPSHQFASYLDPTNPEYPKAVTFEVLYEKLFKRFGLLAPTMNFHKDRFDNPAMAKELLRRMQPENWDKSWYMPATRDVSNDQIELMAMWARKFQAKEINEGGHKSSTSDKSHFTNLQGKEFFKK